MNRFILLGGILIAAWFVFMAVFPVFPYSPWHAFFASCESIARDPYYFRIECPDPSIEAVRFFIIGVSALLIGFASWSFWKGTRD